MEKAGTHALRAGPHRTGLADFPHPALQTGSQAYGINSRVILQWIRTSSFFTTKVYEEGFCVSIEYRVITNCIFI
jgi:hypothetical protein